MGTDAEDQWNTVYDMALLLWTGENKTACCCIESGTYARGPHQQKIITVQGYFGDAIMHSFS